MMLHLPDRPEVSEAWFRLYLALLFTPQLLLVLMESNMGLLRNWVALSLSVSLTSWDLYVGSYQVITHHYNEHKKLKQ